MGDVGLILKKCKWIYDAQVRRCNNKSYKGFKNYGAKGIKVDYTIKEFRVWYLKNYKDGFVVGRIDHDKNYSIDNLTAEPSRSFSTKERNDRIGNPGKKIKVYLVYRRTKEKIALFNTIKECANFIGTSHSQIKRHLDGVVQKPNGKWTYEIFNK